MIGRVSKGKEGEGEDKKEVQGGVGWGEGERGGGSHVSSCFPS